MCYVDIALYDCIESILSMDIMQREEELAIFPKLAAFMLKIEAVPQLQEYLSKRVPVVDAILANMKAN